MTIDQIYKGMTPRLTVVAVLIMIAPASFIARLWDEQLRVGDVHRDSISKQSVRRIRIAPIRGRIFSCDEKLFTDNIPKYDGYFHVHEMRQGGRHAVRQTVSYILNQINRTAKTIGRDTSITEKELKRHLYIYPALPFKAFPDLTDAEHAKLSEGIPGIPGLEITIGIKRTYPLGPVGAHIIGFVGNKDPKYEEDRSLYSYFLPELAGRSGLERLWDSDIRGQGGCKLVRVDSMGFFHNELEGALEAEPGNDFTLTLDSRAQSIARQLLVGKKGAIVVVSCLTGAVIAMESSPTYDLNALSGSRYAELAMDKADRPLLNRSISAGYSPGSIVKPLVALALMEAGAIDEDTLYNCIGYHTIGDTKIRCSNRYGHGEINVLQAIEGSCNPYFIAAALGVGLERLQPLLWQAGLGQETGFELQVGNAKGVFPTRARKWKRQRERWNAFDTALISIGQGHISLSPLQATVFTAAIANGGTVYRPFILKAVKDEDGRIIRETEPKIKSQLEVSPESLRIIQQAMHNVLYGNHATAPLAITQEIELAGKTGTAEIGYGEKKRKNTWFICYGPFESPEYAMTVLVEDGESGGKTAAPLAREFFNRYLQKLRHDRI